MESTLKIIIIDDDIGVIEAIRANLAGEYSVDGFSSSKDGIEALRENSYDLLILDYFVDGMNGRQIAEKIRKFNDDIYIMLLTGKAEEVPALMMLKTLDIQMYCEKSSNFESILVMIESAINSIKHSRKESSFGMRLKKLRKLHNISQEDLGKVLGVGRTAVANWETGLTDPTADSIRKIADIFKVTTDYLLCYNAAYFK